MCIRDSFTPIFSTIDGRANVKLSARLITNDPSFIRLCFITLTDWQSTIFNQFKSYFILGERDYFSSILREYKIFFFFTVKVFCCCICSADKSSVMDYSLSNFNFMVKIFELSGRGESFLMYWTAYTDRVHIKRRSCRLTPECRPCLLYTSRCV